MASVSVIARLTALPGKRPELVVALESAIKTAEEEPGTLMYNFHADNKDEDTLWSYEVFEDQSALDAHMRSDAFKQFGAALATLLAGRPTMNMLTPIGGKGLPKSA